MTISIIVAIGKNNEIGKGNDLLCHLPADLKHFKEITSGHTVIMGRKTFDSLPKGPLPNRKNIVISRNKDLKIEGAIVYSSLDYALIKLMDEDEVFIIGGAQMYAQILPDADKLYLTKIHAEFPEADVFFPSINYHEWREVSRETHLADEKHPYSFTFVEYER
ncbi:dihydrofolate reductase [Bacteroidia bacterium]|nr:dihydrofolate reductase [Bacteroidia bacterium]GHT45976.1 dihydrofolate reductase [Bacteroidia bacterium]